MGFADSLKNMFTDNELPRVNVASPNQNAAFSRTSGEYDQASRNPNYGMPTPEMQALYENELTRDINAHTAGGAGHSGYQGEQVRKGLVDFRIGLIQQRLRALDNIRSAMVQSTGPAMGTADQQPGILNQAARRIGGMAAKNIGEDIFGGGGENQAQSQQSGGAPGTTGYRPEGQKNQGGMSVS